MAYGRGFAKLGLWVAVAVIAAASGGRGDILPPTREAEEPLNELISQCIAAGGLRAAPPGSGFQSSPGDPMKLREAVAANRQYCTRPVRDLLVFFCGRVRGDDREALTLLLRTVGEVTRDELAMGYASFHTGRIAVQKGDLPNALQAYEAGAEHFREAKETGWTGVCLNNAAFVLMQSGEYRQAVTRYSAALDALRRAHGPAHRDVGTTLGNLGHLYGELGEFDRGLQHLKQARVILESLDPKGSSELAAVHSFTASVYDLARRYPEAVKEGLKALAMTQAIEGASSPQAGVMLTNLGNIYNKQGRYQEALEALTKGLELIDAAAPGGPNSAATVATIGTVHRNLGDLPRALASLQDAVDRWTRVYGARHPDIVQALHMQGHIHQERGLFAAALERFDAALSSSALEPGSMPGSVPSSVPADGRSSPAYSPSREVVRLLSHRGEMQEELAFVEQDPARRVERLERSLAEFSSAGAMLDRVRAGMELSGDKLKAGEDEFQLFPRLVGVCVKLGVEGRPQHSLAAFNAAEQGTARVFLEQLARARASNVGGVRKELQQREAALAVALESLDTQLARASNPRSRAAVGALLERRTQLAAEHQELTARMRREYPRYAAMVHPTPCSLRDAAACLRPNEAALHFVLGREGSYVIQLENRGSSGGLAIARLPEQAKIDGAVNGLLAAVGAGRQPTVRGGRQPLRGTRVAGGSASSMKAVRERGAALYSMLLGPLKEELQGKKLLIIPSGRLAMMPFELLVEDGRFLLERHQIRYAPSLTTLHTLRVWEQTRPARPTAAAGQLWAMGDPEYTPAARVPVQGEGRTGAASPLSFERLPYSGEEVRTIGGIFGAGRSTIRVGKAATEGAVKAASQSGSLGTARYVHFAVHGVLGMGEGRQPALVLSQSGRDREDGILTMEEVSGLKLNANLVVLSACHTGQGRLADGEGVTGLARAFLHAGSRGVLCSLWQVPDRDTSMLMADVYRGLKRGLTPDAALREAQLRMMRSGRPPDSWAPFVHIGA